MVFYVTYLKDATRGLSVEATSDDPTPERAQPRTHLAYLVQ